MKYIFTCIVVFALCFGAGTMVLAQSSGTESGLTSDTEDGLSSGTRGSGVIIDNPINSDTIEELFLAIIDIALVFAVPIIVFFIIYAGFLYVTAQGDTGKIQKAHMALLYALIGGLLILGARVLIDVIQGTVNAIK